MKHECTNCQHSPCVCDMRREMAAMEDMKKKYETPQNLEAIQAFLDSQDPQKLQARIAELQAQLREQKRVIEALATLANKQIFLLENCEVAEEFADEAHELWLYCDDRYYSVEELIEWAQAKAKED